MKQKRKFTAKEKAMITIEFIIVAAGLSFMIYICMLVGSCACSFFPKTYSSGDFTYEYEQYVSDKNILITGLTEQGQQKEVLVIPESINGHKVIGLMQNEGVVFGNPTITLKSENLTTLYFCKKVGLEVIMEFPNLKKVFVINAKEDISLYQQGVGSGELEDKCYIYYEVHFNRAGRYSMPPYPANVTYYYNYEGAENYGCYWLDNLGDGEKITYIPSDPTREGYKFDGWYHEPECKTKWDFETDTVESSGEEGYTDKDKFIENKIYAKWTKK